MTGPKDPGDGHDPSGPRPGPPQGPPPQGPPPPVGPPPGSRPPGSPADETTDLAPVGAVRPGTNGTTDAAGPATPTPGADDASDAPASPDGQGTSAATKAPSLKNLSQTLQRGAAISAVVLVVVQFVSFAQTLAVARLLTPTEVGVFTAGTVLANFMAEFSEGGLKNALIQREDHIDDAADTVFWATLINGVLMGAVALAAAPIVGAFFGGELAGVVCAVTSGVVVIHSLVNVPEGLMQRQFNFKRRLIVDPTKAITFAAVAVGFAATGFGVWSLVFGLYSAEILALILIWILAKWRPGRGRPSYRLWRELARVGAPLVIKGMGNRFREVVEAGLVGRFLGQAPLGAYRYGRRIAVLPGMAILQVASYVLLPAFSRIMTDPARMRRGFLKAVTMLWVATVPAALLLVAVGEHLVVVMLGEDWRGAGLVLVGMAGYGPGMAMTAVGSEALTGAGKSYKINWCTATNIVVGLTSLVALIPFGLLGVGLAVSIESLIGGALCLTLALPLASVTRPEAVRLLLPPVGAGAVAAVAAFALEHSVFHSDQRSVALGAVMLLADAALFAVVYLVALRLVAPSSFGELVDAFVRIRDMLTRRGRGAAPEDPGPIPVSELEEEDEAVTRQFTAYEMALVTAAIPLGDFDTIPMRRVPAAPPPPPRRSVPIRIVPDSAPAGRGARSDS